jgi:hypothetical protein
VGPTVLIFSRINQTDSNLKVKNGCLTVLQKFPSFHAARLGHYEQFSQLCQRQNLNRCRVKIPGKDSQFEFSVNF